jgi:hypothetical protein
VEQDGRDEEPTPVMYGLETERMCEIVITGQLESVELAKVRILVLLDELVGIDAPKQSHADEVERPPCRALRDRL